MMDEAQILLALLSTTLGQKSLFVGIADGFAKAYLPVIYANGEAALGIGAYPSLVSDGGTIPSVVRHRQEHASTTLLAVRESFVHTFRTSSLKVPHILFHCASSATALDNQKLSTCQANNMISRALFVPVAEAGEQVGRSGRHHAE
jgi:hypothetical protein